MRIIGDAWKNRPDGIYRYHPQGGPFRIEEFGVIAKIDGDFVYVKSFSYLNSFGKPLTFMPSSLWKYVEPPRHG